MKKWATTPPAPSPPKAATFAGTARLEEKALTFRGDTRLAIPLAIIAEIQAHEGRLSFKAGGRQLVLELGASAEKWAKRMTSPPSRIEKLGVKAGMRVGLAGLDDPALVEDIESRGAAIASGAGAAGLDMIFFAAHALADLDQLAALAARIQPAGAIWLVRVKGTAAPIPESESMAAAKRAGLVDVKVVSYSNTPQRREIRHSRRQSAEGAAESAARDLGRSGRASQASPLTRTVVICSPFRSRDAALRAPTARRRHRHSACEQNRHYD